MSILSPDNKQMLLQLLDGHPLLQGNSQQFYQAFKFHLERIHKGRFHFNNDLMLMNKELIRIFSQISLQKPQQKDPPLLKIGKTVSKAGLIEKRLKEHQHHFEQSIKMKKPDEIDFRDKTDEQPMRDADRILEQRQQELDKIMSNYQSTPTASKWIGGDDGVEHLAIDHDSAVQITSTPLPTVTDSTPDQQSERLQERLQERSQERSQEPKQKRVTFQIAEDSPKRKITDTFLKQLKKPDIEELLLKVLQNQERILQLLEKE